MQDDVDHLYIKRIHSVDTSSYRGFEGWHTPKESLSFILWTVEGDTSAPSWHLSWSPSSIACLPYLLSSLCNCGRLLGLGDGTPS
jgi:hypothetical protein